MTTDLLRDGADPLPLKATHAHELDDLLAPKVAMLTRALARASQAEARTQFGFSQTEWQVVTLLASSQPASIRKLAGFAMVDAAQISRAVVSLSRQGLVERRTSERDNRQAALRLSPQAWTLPFPCANCPGSATPVCWAGFQPSRSVNCST